MLYYFASCFDLSKKKLARLYRLQQRVVIGRSWIQGARLAGVISSFKIGPTCDMNAAFQRAKIAMCLRFYGLEAIKNANSRHPVLDRANKFLLHWHTLEPELLDKLMALAILPPEEMKGNRSLQVTSRKNTFQIS